jgi:hypothetical protein
MILLIMVVKLQPMTTEERKSDKRRRVVGGLPLFTTWKDAFPLVGDTDRAEFAIRTASGDPFTTEFLDQFPFIKQTAPNVVKGSLCIDEYTLLKEQTLETIAMINIHNTRECLVASSSIDGPGNSTSSSDADSSSEDGSASASSDTSGKSVEPVEDTLNRILDKKKRKKEQFVAETVARWTEFYAV